MNKLDKLKYRPFMLHLAWRLNLILTWKVRENGFLNPRLGRRRRRGVWPPSNPNFIVPRALWPLWPLPAVFPFPDPIPRPFLVFCLRAPLLSCRSFKLRRLYALVSWSKRFLPENPLKSPELGGRGNCGDRKCLAGGRIIAELKLRFVWIIAAL